MTRYTFTPKIHTLFEVRLLQGFHMIFRVLLFTLLFSINAYAKPEKSNQSQTSIQATEDDLSKQLTSHDWQITRIAKQAGFSFNAEHWIFNFSSNGKYKAFGTCNHLSGNIKSDDTGTFRISNLVGSNNHCSDSKDEENMVFNTLLMIDAFEIKYGELLLKYNGQGLIELKPTDKIVNLKANLKAQKVTKSEESLPPKKIKGHPQGKDKSKP